MSKQQFPKEARDKFRGMTDAQIVDSIKSDQDKMPKDKHLEIQQYVSEQIRLGFSKREIKRMVKDKFKVIIV